MPSSEINFHAFGRGDYRIEKTLHTPRADSSDNEDSHFILAHTDGSLDVGVFDGATGVGSVAAPFKTKMGQTLGMNRDVSGGVFASKVVAGSAEHYAVEPLYSPEQLLLLGAKSLRRELTIMGVRQECLTQVASTLGAIVRFSPDGSMRWALTDSDVNIVVTRGKTNSVEWMTPSMPLDDQEAKSLSLALKISPEDISQVLASSKAIQEKINNDRSQENQAHMYGSINGDDLQTIRQMIRSGTTQLRSGDKVHLFTDGLLLYKPREAYSYEDIWEGTGENLRRYSQQQRKAMEGILFYENGEENVRRVMAQEVTDPLCIKFPRFKASGDDKTRIDIGFQMPF
jgi:hypothetical protein